MCSMDTGPCVRSGITEASCLFREGQVCTAAAAGMLECSCTLGVGGAHRSPLGLAGRNRRAALQDRWKAARWSAAGARGRACPLGHSLVFQICMCWDLAGIWHTPSRVRMSGVGLALLHKRILRLVAQVWEVCGS